MTRPLPVLNASPGGTPLVDRHGRGFRSLRISVTPACNFACVYCRPADHETFRHGSALLSFPELVRVAGVAAGLGFTKLRLTGGEPLVRPGLPGLVRDLKAVRGVEQVALTTNGSLLPRHARALYDAGLDRVNVSLDSLNQETAAELAGKDVLADVLAGLDAAAAAGLPVKLNCVPVRGVNDREAADLVRFAHARGWELRFIEFMPMGEAGRLLDGTHADGATVPGAELRARLAAAGYRLRRDRLTPRSDPARGWVCDATGARVGFVGSLTENFCHACDRMRLTAEGQLRPCLHQDAGVSLRGPLRAGASDDRLAGFFRDAAALKWAGHRITADAPEYSAREMISVGG